MLVLYTVITFDISALQCLTVRDNITFGLPMEKDKYNDAIHCCSMLSDLEIMDAGDMTEVTT